MIEINPALMPTYNRAPVTFVRGEGCELIDAQGVRYLDAIAGIAVCALGHAHPAIADAVAEQANTLVHTSNLYHHEPSGTLARLLVERSGLARAFFCNSGAEANEAAIKLARKLAFRSGEPDRTTIVACSGSFHGRTYGALAATANDAYKIGFGPMLAGFVFTPFNDIAALQSVLDASVAAFIVEPVQGESGVHPADPDFLRAARRLCDEHGIVLIFDEIQCGMGRVGPLFAFQEYGVVPDVVTMAKALANGLPIGAVLVADRAARALQPGDHGSTFGGSPVSAAAAIAHLRVRDELHLEDHVRKNGAALMKTLRALASDYPSVFGVPRGMGLLLGLPVLPPFEAGELVGSLRERRILVGSAGGNTLRFAPPLILTQAHIARIEVGLRLVADALGAVESS